MRACCRRCWQRRIGKKIRRKERDKQKLSSGKIEFQKSVANAETMQHRLSGHGQAHKTAVCSAGTEVSGSDLHPVPRQDKGLKLS